MKDNKSKSNRSGEKTTREREELRVARREQIQKRILLICLSLVGLLFVAGLIAAIVLYFVPHNSSTYAQAVEYLENEEYTLAYNTFRSLGDYKDSSDQADAISIKFTGKKDAIFASTASSPYYSFNDDGALQYNHEYESASKKLVIADVIDDKLVTEISASCFSGLKWLTEITLPDGVLTVGDKAFNGCTALTTVHFGDHVRTIGNSVFEGCTSLTTVQLPDTLKNLSSSAFYGCTALKEIVIPHLVEQIPSKTFFNCTSLEQVTLSANLRSIETSAFESCTSLQTIKLPDTLESIRGSAFYRCTSLSSITIPDSVTTLSSHVFEDCTGLTEVTIGRGVTILDQYLFAGCKSLTTVNLIPGNITEVRRAAFEGCPYVPEINTADGNS